MRNKKWEMITCNFFHFDILHWNRYFWHRLNESTSFFFFHFWYSPLELIFLTYNKRVYIFFFSDIFLWNLYFWHWLNQSQCFTTIFRNWKNQSTLYNHHALRISIKQFKIFFKDIVHYLLKSKNTRVLLKWTEND